MRLQRLNLLRYGLFTDRSFELPVGNIDFHVVFGPNEAGKSTALSAIEGLLFDISDRSPYGFLHDYPSMRIGAVLENGGESLEIVRRKGLKNTLLDADGLQSPEAEAKLRSFLAGADSPFFKRMFSLDRARLEKGGREILEAKDEIGQMLFSIGAGITGLRDRLGDLSNEADKLWAPRKGKSRKYYQAYDKMENSRRNLRQYIVTVTKWQELKRTFETSEQDYTNAQTEFEEASAELKKLSRIRRVHPLVCRKVELDDKVEVLGTVISLPEDASEVLDKYDRKESEASTRINTFSDRLSKACAELKNLNYDEKLVLHADDIRQLNERRIEIRGEKQDLPKRQKELDVEEDKLCILAAELNWQEQEVDELIERIPIRAKLKTVRSLLSQHGELASDVENKTRALEEAKDEYSDLQGLLDSIGEITDVSKLEAVIKTVRESGDLAGRVQTADQQVKDEQRLINQLFSSLNLSVTNENDVAEMQVPLRTTVQSHRDKVVDLERRTRETTQQSATAKEELEQTREALQDVVHEEHVITTEEVEGARTARDELWGLVKQRHIENVPISEDETRNYLDVLDDLGGAFETAMHTADNLADRRFDKSEQVGRLAELSRNLKRQGNSLKRLVNKGEELAHEGENLNIYWRTLWEKVPLELLTPDAMLEWLEKYNKLLKGIERRVEATERLEFYRRQERAAREGLLMELSLIGTNCATLENDTLAVILECSDSIQHKHKQKAGEEDRTKKDLRRAATNEKRRRHELTRAENNWSQWQEKWVAGLNELGLSTDLNTGEISAQIDIIDQMREISSKINDLRYNRIGKINRDIAEFKSVVANTVAELATDLKDIIADDAVKEIERRLRKAEYIRDLQTRKEEEVEEIKNKINEWKENRQDTRDSIRYLKDIIGTDAINELRNAIEKSDTLRSLERDLSETLQKLEQQGDGLSVAELDAECANVDIDYVGAREESITNELRNSSDRLTDFGIKLQQARDAFEAIGGDNGAAQAEAIRQEAVAEIREIAGLYIRVRTSAILLQWAIDRYRREKQAPLLKRAGELFARMTRDSFKDLRVDYDKNDHPHLTGIRPDGKSVPVSGGMSSGTTDQLYLALRVASIEDYLDHAGALPFVADDLFVNFDDERAGAGFKVLGELSRKTQVLFFTHHLHLLEIARSALGDSISIINLNE